MTEGIRIETVLKHVVDISCHRDQSLLDISLLTAIQSLTGTKWVRMLEITTTQKDMLVHARAWIEQDRVIILNEYSPTKQTQRPLAHFAILAAAIEQNLSSVKDSAPDGMQTLWIPIWNNKSAVACLEFAQQGPITKQVVFVLEGLLQVYRNFQNILDYSERDTLTGLLNRKTFDSNLSKVLSFRDIEAPSRTPSERRHLDPQKQHWLAVIDIDHFKRINDKFGHLYGDEVLILIANLMLSSFRTADRIFRFGGEEFVVLLRSTTLEEAHMVAERFRVAVETHTFPQVGNVTVSIGFAGIHASDSPVDILGHADQALYYAKNNGRNLVAHYEALLESGVLQREVAANSVEFF
ncbi:MAG TPA: GGDEF domain-containing protein [Herbaspirillum sp.]|jgi:diguanylate cyclase (GGDEF)-like protein